MDKLEKIARRLHYIDWFYRQLPSLECEWENLKQSQRNQYLNFAQQIIKIIEET